MGRPNGLEYRCARMAVVAARNCIVSHVLTASWRRARTQPHAYGAQNVIVCQPQPLKERTGRDASRACRGRLNVEQSTRRDASIACRGCLNGEQPPTYSSSGQPSGTRGRRDGPSIGHADDIWTVCDTGQTRTHPRTRAHVCRPTWFLNPKPFRASKPKPSINLELVSHHIPKYHAIINCKPVPLCSTLVLLVGYKKGN